ncbi:Aste57867_9220 [Aphanomyces stellatus]|uniref:Aste57867_9220 protein n=1 Tax=Aphanomyces stellatus TaxID=120398 RepID=A0A485KMN7_9STRA|nr:hypothetical protein As57867_009184 [Aphanomyces stellatus]VFT86103.1 Aste57867_9220 [Aphanomyces stellatus]
MDEMTAQIQVLRAQVAVLTREKTDHHTRLQRRIDFLERQVDALRRTRGTSFHRRRASSSMSSDGLESTYGGSIDWTIKADAAADTVVFHPHHPTKRTWRDVWRNLFGKRGRDGDGMRQSTWEAKMTTTGKIVFVNPEGMPPSVKSAAKTAKKKRRGISGDSMWV